MRGDGSMLHISISFWEFGWARCIQDHNSRDLPLYRIIELLDGFETFFHTRKPQIGSHGY